MKKIILIVVAFLAINSSLRAQDVEVDKKTGLVKVEGQDAFYLTPKNKSMMQNDFALENLNHEELAYLKYEEGVRYTSSGEHSTTNFLMVFTKSGNQCYLTGFSLISGYMKPIAKKIAGANLVQNGVISLTEERKFIVLNNGTFVKESPTPVPTERVIVTSEQPRTHIIADIALKENKIYNNSELVGIFKRSMEGNINIISVYNNNDVLVCKATHEDGNDNADWNIQTEGKNTTLLYNNATPLEKLFKYLVEKAIL
ncbi:MAG TPA: hypothetical protein VL098_01230 [Flavipsychrobacter sp.]|nr:hypothetical protein [Flavipsychrobacter sp.]